MSEARELARLQRVKLIALLLQISTSYLETLSRTSIALNSPTLTSPSDYTSAQAIRSSSPIQLNLN